MKGSVVSHVNRPVGHHQIKRTRFQTLDRIPVMDLRFRCEEYFVTSLFIEAFSWSSQRAKTDSRDWKVSGFQFQKLVEIAAFLADIEMVPQFTWLREDDSTSSALRHFFPRPHGTRDVPDRTCVHFPSPVFVGSAVLGAEELKCCAIRRPLDARVAR